MGLKTVVIAGHHHFYWLPWWCWWWILLNCRSDTYRCWLRCQWLASLIYFFSGEASTACLLVFIRRVSV